MESAPGTDGDENFRMEGIRAHRFSRTRDSVLNELIRESRIAERVALDTCRVFISTLRNDDRATRRIMERIAQIEKQSDAMDGSYPK
jgi:hypothetical protein